MSTIDRNQVTRPLLEELRRMIKRSEYSQRRIEELAGFSKGYLSQLLAQNLDIKVWHVLAILEVFDMPPGDLFARVYPEDGDAPSSAHDDPLARLLRGGVQSLQHLRQRLELCEDAVSQLEGHGLVELGRSDS